jgi:hypothetical protein
MGLYFASTIRRCYIGRRIKHKNPVEISAGLFRFRNISILLISSRGNKVNEKPEVSRKERTGGATVTVASKMQTDFILQLHYIREETEPVLGGGVRVFKIARPRTDIKPILISGLSYAQNKGPHQRIEIGYAMTPGVPKDFWDEWLEQNKNADYVVNGMIFAHSETASLMSEAKEKESLKSGIERLNPQDLPKGIQPSDRKAA